MTENQEVPGRRRRSGEEIKRLVLEFEASGLRKTSFSESRFGVEHLTTPTQKMAFGQERSKRSRQICRGGVGQEGVQRK
jgi:hypothetical protein